MAAPSALRLATLLTVVATAASAQVPGSAVDDLFADFHGTEVPGCAVGVSQHHQQVLARAYGMADLEHRVINTPETVFEPGSVSKQFTAAATILLALDGKISLDDDVRTYIPELPDYGHAITVRHLLNHTSGLRDWGSVAAMGGWPRGTRTHTHTHMLDIASRQHALNYEPGEFYSYTNTGYNLQAVLVERVSGMSFADFTRTRIFEPLGMSRTEWRDDYTRIVPDRAIAYVPRNGVYHMNMPFEDVHGNGGLLTTVGDLLRFTHNLETGVLGGPEFIQEMHTQGVLNSGETIAYASGLSVGQYKGVREVQHSGATAGYRGFLTRFPDHGLAVAVICNAGNANAGGLAHQVADLYLGDALVEETEEAHALTPVDVPEERLAALAGAYKRVRDDAPAFVLQWTNGELRFGGEALVPVLSSRLVGAESGATLELMASSPGEPATGVATPPNGSSYRVEQVELFDPDTDDLGQYTGEYRSDEAEVTYSVELREGQLALVDRYGEAQRLRPTYRDGFVGPRGPVIFRRDGGEVSGLSLVAARVWDLRFQRIGN